MASHGAPGFLWVLSDLYYDVRVFVTAIFKWSDKSACLYTILIWFSWSLVETSHHHTRVSTGQIIREKPA